MTTGLPPLRSNSRDQKSGQSTYRSLAKMVQQVEAKPLTAGRWTVMEKVCQRLMRSGCSGA
jgi:hypothetical protein